MRQARFYISLYIIIPFIITGLSILAAIISFRLTKYSLAHGSDPAQPVFWFILVISIIAFVTGFMLVRFILKPVERFVEKPRFDRAVEYLNSGRHRWNAGMFIWGFVTITEGLQQHHPALYNACQRWFAVAGHSSKLAKVLAKDYPELKRISIDYALMEHAHNVVVAAGDFAWDDLGSWNALGRHLKADPEGNCVVGDFIHVDAARNIVFDARKKHRTPIAVVGLRDAILVQTDDAVLLAHKSQAQKVKELVKRLAEDRRLRKWV